MPESALKFELVYDAQAVASVDLTAGACTVPTMLSATKKGNGAFWPDLLPDSLIIVLAQLAAFVKLNLHPHVRCPIIPLLLLAIDGKGGW